MDSTWYKCTIIYLAVSRKLTYQLFFYLQRVHRKTQCTAENGVSIDAMKVFTHCINYLRESLLKDRVVISTSITMDDIDFVLTVPATWDDTAKMLLREAAVQVHTPHIEHNNSSPFSYYFEIEKKSKNQNSFLIINFDMKVIYWLGNIFYLIYFKIPFIN